MTALRFLDDRLADLAPASQPKAELYARTDPRPALDQPTVAIVGARACSAYGAGVAAKLATRLASEGVTVVSGLARGIDAVAHRACVEAGGRTVAVLGCGIDRDYPRTHSMLAERIGQGGGAVVSEYAPGVLPEPWRFPARNRIIAALADVVVIVEARERSGALITVDLAMEIGRPIFAVPGEMDSALSASPNRLIREGHAVCLSDFDQVMHRLRNSPRWVASAERAERRRAVAGELADARYHVVGVDERAATHPSSRHRRTRPRSCRSPGCRSVERHIA